MSEKIKNKPLSCDMFTEEKYNALYSALVTATENMQYDSIYDCMEQCPKTSFIVFLVDALEEHGYFIGS